MKLNLWAVDPRRSAVIPAKAGIQVLVLLIVPPTGGQSMYELVLAVPEPRSGYFLLLVSRSAHPALSRHSYIPVQHPKVPKEKDTPNGASELLRAAAFG